MSRAVQQVCFLSLLVLSCNVWQGRAPRGQPEDLDADQSVGAAVAAVLAELRPVLYQIQSDLNCLKKNMTTLSESVRNLTATVELHNRQTASQLSHLQSLVAQYPSDNIPTESPTVAQVPTTLDLLVSQLNSTATDLLASVKLECDKKLEMMINSSAIFREEWYAFNNTSCPESKSNHSSVTMSLTRLGESMQGNYSLLLKNSYGYITTPPKHICKGEGGWRHVFLLNMTNDDAECPYGWKRLPSPKPTCGRSSDGSHTCDSIFISVPGGPYTRVCGSIKAYQMGPTDAFEAYDEGSVTSIDGAYVSGVSLTHGSPRRHIWTFAAGIREAYHTRNDACPCDATINITVPAFVNNGYFCESGHNMETTTGFSQDDPLWDGEGCSADSTCCSFNNPPYFLQQLPTPTHDDIEARICHKEMGDDTPVEFMEVYVK